MRFGRRVIEWLEDRTGLGDVVRRLLRHPVPPGTGWMYVLGSGTLVAFGLQLVTGAALATVYVPAAGSAYESLQYITERALLGRFLRGMHYFGASAMVVLIGMHMLRVFLTGSYKFPREMNWLSGVLLFALTMSMAFTGQVLRWDQDGVWSAVIGAEQASRAPFVGRALARFLLSGDNIGGETLSHFFAYHVFIIPGFIILGISLHLYLVLRSGISEPPSVAHPVERATYRDSYRALLRDRGVPFFPDALWRDVVFGVGVLLIIIALAILLGPRKLGLPPDPSLLARDPRPDWYLLSYFALLAVLPPRLENLVIWLLPLVAGAALMALPLLFPDGHRHPARRPWAWMFALLVPLVGGVLLELGADAPWTPKTDAPALQPAVVASTDSIIVRGAALFHDRACESCHRISGFGGDHGPDLTYVGDRLSTVEITLRIANGAREMPAYGRHLTGGELEALTAFLNSRTADLEASRHGH